MFGTVHGAYAPRCNSTAPLGLSLPSFGIQAHLAGGQARGTAGWRGSLDPGGVIRRLTPGVSPGSTAPRSSSLTSSLSGLRLTSSLDDRIERLARQDRFRAEPSLPIGSRQLDHGAQSRLDRGSTDPDPVSPATGILIPGAGHPGARL